MSLLYAVIGYFRLFLNISCPLPGISHFFKEQLELSLNAFGEDARHVQCLWVLIVSGLFQWAEVGNVYCFKDKKYGEFAMILPVCILTIRYFNSLHLLSCAQTPGSQQTPTRLLTAFSQTTHPAALE